MINDVPKPDISPNFTVDDIRKIRVWNYERQKNMTSREKIVDTRKRADEVLNLIAERKRAKAILK
jgi:hypothetical protein